MGRLFVQILPISSFTGCEDNSEEHEEEEDFGRHELNSDDDESVENQGIFVCRCGVHLTRGTDLVSKDFRGKSGKAYLFRSVVNASAGKPEDRPLITGLHTIADIFCVECKRPLGWKYLHAFNESQRYKVGKFILERAFVRRIGET